MNDAGSTNSGHRTTADDALALFTAPQGNLGPLRRRFPGPPGLSPQEGVTYACLLDNARGRVTRLTFNRSDVVWAADILVPSFHEYLVFSDDSGSQLALGAHRVLWPWSEHRLITSAASFLNVAVVPRVRMGGGRWWDLDVATVLKALMLVRPESERLRACGQAARRKSVVRLGVPDMVHIGNELDAAF